MKHTDFKTVEEYIASFPEDVQEILKELRRVIKTAVPEAEEVISYQMPTYKLNGPVIYFAAHQNFYSVYSPPPAMEVFKKDLAGYKTSKSAINLPYDQPVPKELIARIAQWRAEENARQKRTKS